MGKLETEMRKRQSSYDTRGIHPYLLPRFQWPDLSTDGKTLELMTDKELSEFIERRKRYDNSKIVI